MYVFEVIPDYQGAGRNLPLTALADFDNIPPALLAKIRGGCATCVTRLLSALWDDQFSDIEKKGHRYRSAPRNISWKYLLNPADPDAARRMSAHMRR